MLAYSASLTVQRVCRDLLHTKCVSLLLGSRQWHWYSSMSVPNSVSRTAHLDFSLHLRQRDLRLDES
jgi:hypothetical protein